jgi:hypothetical protein
LREYQLTLRNTSAVHLQNVEIQLGFPAEDVQEYASPRTTLSKTAFLKVDVVPTDATAFLTVFRWRIPHLPSGDSVEFAFQAVNPPSENNGPCTSVRVIVERVEGEPAPTKRSEHLDGDFLHSQIMGYCAATVSIMEIRESDGSQQIPDVKLDEFVEFLSDYGH